ncbi:MAG: hypothetical protein IJS67_00535, partial [Clostridia bacterium]|nr:hypothetical protein [Clostridia bacterium]
MLYNEKSPLDIIVVAGQSNAAGCGLGETDDPYFPDKDILGLYDPQTLPMVAGDNGYERVFVKEPWDFTVNVADEELCGDVKRANFGLFFAREYKRRGLLKEGRKILLVFTACGSTGFCSGHWGMGDSLYRRMLDMTDTALGLNKDNRLVAFLWHQGESESVYAVGTDPEKREKIHYKNLRRLLESVRARYALPDLPILAGGFSSEWRRLNPYHDDGAKAVLK